MTDVNIKGEKAKPVKPDLYYRERSKLNSQLLQLEFYFTLVNKNIKDKEKVIFAAFYMRGRALNWISTDMTRYIDNDDPDNNIKEWIEDFGKFKKRIRMIFGPANKKALAESIIQTLRQTTLASDYNIIFRYYAAKTDWNNDIQISIYKRGLKDNIQDKLIRYKIRARIDNLDDFIKVFIGLDDKLY